MYLTRLEINPARRGARHLLASPQAMHAAVMAAFSRTVNSTGGRALWRVDRGDSGIHLYVVSPWKPDLSHVVEQAGWPTTQAWETLDYRPFLDRLAADQTWRFRLTADPTRSIGGADGVRGKRVGHVTVAQQSEWLLRRAGGFGFEIPAIPTESGEAGEPALVISRRERPVFTRRRADGGKDRVTIDRVVFDGALRVTDAEKLRSAMVNGIGPAKAYGCGLLTLAQQRSVP